MRFFRREVARPAGNETTVPGTSVFLSANITASRVEYLDFSLVTTTYLGNSVLLPRFKEKPIRLTEVCIKTPEISKCVYK